MDTPTIYPDLYIVPSVEETSHEIKCPVCDTKGMSKIYRDNTDGIVKDVVWAVLPPDWGTSGGRAICSLQCILDCVFVRARSQQEKAKDSLS